MSKLNIYRASAGSGKTYTLTREYLKLLFRDSQNYKHILAVTFTNKATDEMKSRILKEINILAEGEKSAYQDELCDIISASKAQLQIIAKDIQNRLLHDYSRFSVTTIDSFFQKIVRSFTREIGLQMGFNIELDQKKVLDNVVDHLFLDVDKDVMLKKWLISFAEDKIKNGKTWNFKHDILELGSEVFKEDFKNFDDQLIDKLSDKNFLINYQKVLRELKEDFENVFAIIGEKCRNILEANSLKITDFSYGKSGVMGFLASLGQSGKYEPGIRVRQAVDNPDKWVAKKAKAELKASVETALQTGLNDMAKQAVEYYDKEFMLYNSCKLSLKYIYTLGILTDLSKKLNEFTFDENIFMLSEASRLLRSIIADTDSPFVYEKIGNVYKHFMIDEFQDTSAMQWDNFRPLVTNSLAEDNTSLVVGDVKQSIYRWRNGDWKLLAEQLDIDFADLGVNSLNLDYNWRSTKRVIDYNNAFYTIASDILQSDYNADIPEILTESLGEEMVKIKNAYKDIFQMYPEMKTGNKGYVCSEFVEVEKDENWIDVVLFKIPSLIEEIQNNNFRAKDIAILVRNAKEGRLIADTIMKYKLSEDASEKYNYNVISNDSLFLKNSSVISLIVHILRFFVVPQDKINAAYIIQEYKKYILNEKNNLEFDELINLSDISKDDNVFEKFLPKEFYENIESLKRLAVYDLVEQIIDIFSLNKKHTDYPYLQAFQDLILSFSAKDSPDLNSFVNYWDERKDKEVISVSDKQDAIRIMTIHKSKGLEFKAVILPFCDWELDSVKHSNILWCKTNVPGFSDLKLIPVKYGTVMKETIFYKEYYKEKLQSYVDNINLLYVATTRAESALYTFSPLPKKQELKSISDLMHFVYSNAQNYSSENLKNPIQPIAKSWLEDQNIFAWGELECLEIKKEIPACIDLLEYPSNCLDNRLKLRSHSADYFDFSEVESVDSFAPISRGNILHELFQYITYHDKVEESISRLLFEGKLDEKQAAEVRLLTKEIFDIDQVASWFSYKWKVLNERDILMGDNGFMRPDRVIINNKEAIVIDYKFGNKKSKSYHKQIATYMKQMIKMGYLCKGYILYGKLKEVEEIFL